MSLSKGKGTRPKVSAAPEAVAQPEPVSGPQAAEEKAAGEAPEVQTQLAEKTKEAQEYYDRLLRTVAEMENLKKRQERERADLLRFANESLIKELLPVVDNLELALEHGRQQEAPAPLLEGLELVHQGFLKVLDRYGVIAMSSVGQKFDPVYHYAVMEEEDRNVEDRLVIKEMQKGYLMHNRLLRPAMVVVARNPQKTSEKAD
jgi:molecular chaperone GrpE